MADKPEPRILRDLRTLRPEPRGLILYGEHRLAVRSMIDFKLRETRKLLELFGYTPPEGEADTLVQQTERAGERCRLLCPELPDAVLDEMTYGERLAFEDAALAVGPPPLVDSLTRLLEAQGDRPCAEACEHPDCPALREVVALRDKLKPSGPTDPAPATVPGDSSPTLASSTT